MLFILLFDFFRIIRSGVCKRLKEIWEVINVRFFFGDLMLCFDIYDMVDDVCNDVCNMVY